MKTWRFLVETHDYCDLVLEAQAREINEKNNQNLLKKTRSNLWKPGYIGNTMANTSYPTKSKPTGMICKLSFMVRKVIPIEW